MNIFTANQVNQVYVLKGNSTVVANLDASHQITKSNNLGSIGVGKSADGKSIYFKHYGAGGVTRSDLIEIANIIDVKATPASKMERQLATAKITLTSEALSSGSPIVGQDYILKLKFQNPVGMSPDNQYWKNGAVRTFTGMGASDFYKRLALSIANNMAREAVQLVKVYVTISGSSPNAGDVEVTPGMKLEDIKAGTGTTAAAVIIKEVEQDWILGIKQQKPLIFTVETSTINAGTTSAPNEVVWGDIVYNTGKAILGGAMPTNSVADGTNKYPGTNTTIVAPSTTTIVNSKLMADYEYFYMGERADQYRMVNWPDYVPTTYLVNADWQYGYDTIAIHYAYVGANHAVQKSEKDITFVVPRASTDSTASAVGALAASLVAAIEAAIDPGYVKMGTSHTSGKLAVWDSDGTLKASTQSPS